VLQALASPAPDSRSRENSADGALVTQGQHELQSYREREAGHERNQEKSFDNPEIRYCSKRPPQTPALHTVSAQHLQVLLADAALQLQEVKSPECFFVLFFIC
jgi:hypothetical protein